MSVDLEYASADERSPPPPVEVVENAVQEEEAQPALSDLAGLHLEDPAGSRGGGKKKRKKKKGGRGDGNISSEDPTEEINSAEHTVEAATVLDALPLSLALHSESPPTSLNTTVATSLVASPPHSPRPLSPQPPSPSPSTASSSSAPRVVYPLASLLAGATWPEDVPPDSRESFLSDADFEQTLGMSRESFHALPLWRRQQRKKQVGLF